MPSPTRSVVPWQPILLSVSILLAVVFAVGGWALGRRRGHVAVAKSKDAEKVEQVSATTHDEQTIETRPIAAPDASGCITLAPQHAKLTGDVQRLQVGSVYVLAGWSSDQDKAVWQLRAQRPGYYKAELDYAATDAAQDAELELWIGQRKRLCSLRSTGGFDQFVTDEFTVAVPTSGLHHLTIQPHRELRSDWLVLRSVRLVPVNSDKAAEAPPGR